MPPIGPHPEIEDEAWASAVGQEAWRTWKLRPHNTLVVADEIEATLATGVSREEILAAFGRNRGQHVWDILRPLSRQRLRLPEARKVHYEPPGAFGKGLLERSKEP